MSNSEVTQVLPQDFTDAELEQRERNRIKRLIRQGKLPRFHFLKDANGKLPRGHKNGKFVMILDGKTGNQTLQPRKRGLTLTLVSTLDVLMRDFKASK